ncbi:MAG: acyltransferase family protein [Dehalococcoidia bacterium]|nr:acyltransferase family protein [Dehalococcoidia bacterium]
MNRALSGCSQAYCRAGNGNDRRHEIEDHGSPQETQIPSGIAPRLYYIDWLRVLAILGVFLFHATNVFNTMPWHIKNAEQSVVITTIQAFFFPWGMPLFFMIAGAGTWFALKRRTSSQYIKERSSRLLIPFVVGSIILSPIQLYFEWSHKVETGIFAGSFTQFVGSLPWGPNPRIFGVMGYHLWFLGFLFMFSLLALPFFQWVRKGAGQRLISWLAQVCRHRGGILVFTLPPLFIRLGLQPFFPYEHDWADFFFLLSFFVIGYLVIGDERLRQAVRRDWPITLTVGTLAFIGAAIISFSTGELDIEGAPHSLVDFAWWGLFAVCGWCWAAFTLFMGMRFLNFSNRLLRYGQEAIVPFFVVHQPVIIVIAYFVVQLNAALIPKLLIVVIGSLVVSLALYQLVIRRVGVLRVAFGMKRSSRDRIPSKATVS